MRFGESFPQGADSTNRLDVLKIKDKETTVPPYIEFGLEIRDRLKTEVKEQGWPAMPKSEELDSIEDFFKAADNTTDKVWDKSVGKLMSGKAGQWLGEIKDDDPGIQAAKDLLAKPDELAKLMALKQYGPLEVLRKSNPDAWRSLNIASSERQLASIALLQHWLGDKSNLRNLDSLAKKTGFSREELNLLVDLESILGKYVDQAFIKQMELADLPGGSKKTKLGDKQGTESLYDLYKSPRGPEVEIKTYQEIFPFELGKMQDRLAVLAQRVKTKVSEKSLSSSYETFADLLAKLSAVYGSETISPKKIKAQWDEIYKAAAELDKTDCPIMLIPQGAASVAGEAEKVDIEMRFGVKTKETKQLEKDFEVFRGIALDLIEKNQASLDEEPSIPEITFNYQLGAFGPNLTSVTTGESGPEQILVHHNSDRQIVINRELPSLKKIFNQEIDQDKYLAAVPKENTLHEISHSVLKSDDEKVHKKIGGRFEAEILDELKAETVGMKILEEAERSGSLPEDIDMRMQLLAKLGTNLHYLKNNSGEKGSDGEEYFVCGATIIGRLMDKGLMQKIGETYVLGDTRSCVREIASIGDEVLLFYTKENSKPVAAKKYIDSLRDKEKLSNIRELLADLK